MSPTGGLLEEKGREKGETIPDETVERWRTEVSSVEACRSLVLSFLEEFGAERGYLLVWTDPNSTSVKSNGAGSDSGRDDGAPALDVISALAADGADIQDPDFFLDQQRVKKIATSRGAQFLDGVEAGVPRSLLSGTFEIRRGQRGILMLEAASHFLMDLPFFLVVS